MANPFVDFFKILGTFFYNGIFGIVTNKNIRTWFFIIFYLMILMIIPVKEAITDHSIKPVIEKLGGIIADGDKQVYQEIVNIKSIPNPSWWDKLKSFNRIVGYYLFFFLIAFLIYKFWNNFNTSEVWRSYLFTAITILILHIGWSGYLVTQQFGWTGMKSLTLEDIWWVIKPAGTIELIKNWAIYFGWMVNLAGKAQK